MKEVASSSTWLDPCSTITVPRWTPPRVVRWLGGHGLGAPYDLLAALGRRSPSGSISADQFTLGICKLRYVSHQDPVWGVLLLWVRLSAHGGDCIDLKKNKKRTKLMCPVRRIHPIFAYLTTAAAPAAAAVNTAVVGPWHDARARGPWIWLGMLLPPLRNFIRKKLRGHKIEPSWMDETPKIIEIINYFNNN